MFFLLKVIFQNININFNFIQQEKKDKNAYDKNDTPKVWADKVINRAIGRLRKEIEEKNRRK